MQIGIKIKNLEVLQWAMKNFPQKTGKNLQEAIAKSTMLLSRTSSKIIAGKTVHAKAVDTGTLLRSITPRVKILKGTVSPDSGRNVPLKYAKYVHEGTKRMEARPFFDQAVEDTQGKIDKFFEEALTNSLKIFSKK